jgi:hypothetical protein
MAKLKMPPVSLTKPAMLAAISYLILAFMIILPFDIGDCPQNEKPCQYNFARRLMILVIMLIPFGLSIYSINCMMVGQCTVWSWVNGIVIALWVLLFIIASMLSYNNRTSSGDIILISEAPQAPLF